MQAKVDFKLGKQGSTDTYKYVMYSLHDFQIANMVKWLDPVVFQFFMVPYASEIFWELYEVADCKAKDETCFYVTTTYNGDSLGFSKCVSDDDPSGFRCSYPDFKAYI